MITWARNHPIGAITLTALIALAVGLLAGRFVVSPQQAAADSAPPPPTTLTTPVLKGKIKQSVPLDAKVGPSSSVKVSPASPPEDSIAIVSAVHVKPSDTVKSGAALVDVAGRPTFVLTGTITAYRTMSPGSKGKDVAQLQAALRQLGYKINDAEDTYGYQTKAAVRKFYTDRGYPPVMVGTDEVKSAEEALKEAERGEETARKTLKRAKRDNKAAKGERRDSKADEAEDQDSGRDAINDAITELKHAKEDTQKARKDLQQARSVAGAQIPIGEVVFVSKLPATAQSVSVAIGKSAEQASVILTSGNLVAIGDLEQSQAKDVKPKLAATLVTPDGTRVKAKVSAVSDLPGSDGQPPKTRVIVTPEKKLSAKLNGRTVRVILTLTQAQEETLLVPETAIATTADGSSTVQVSENGELRTVAVNVGRAGDGQVSVTPAGDVPLKEGDEVVVGQQ